MGEKRTKKPLGLKKRNKKKESKVELTKSGLYNTNSVNGEDQMVKSSKKRKANKVVTDKNGTEKVDKLNNEAEGNITDQSVSQENTETKTREMKKKTRKDKKRKKVGEDKADEIHQDGVNTVNGKLKDSCKKKKKNRALLGKDVKVMEEKAEPEEDDAYEMSSGDEDCSRGMKKWITEYHQSRPGLKVLQDQIDDFITAHEEQEEEARKAREAQAAEGGWTVVTHLKGRKKTTEAESGTTVGSVASTAVLENLAKKKNKDVGIDFYRFQKREARMNELMALQSKFEQDKKRIQQMRAARKFRPY